MWLSKYGMIPHDRLVSVLNQYSLRDETRGFLVPQVPAPARQAAPPSENPSENFQTQPSFAQSQTQNQGQANDSQNQWWYPEMMKQLHAGGASRRWVKDSQ